ncbi:MAG TPA: DoxX family protein [Puia sp.]|nr:DoxX family protein [Puia sp.]
MINQTKNKTVNILLWLAQGLLTIAFLIGGSYVLCQPVEALTGKMSFVNHYSVFMVKFIGACEVLGAIGLLLPSVLKIKPSLTPLAALGLAVIMVLATNYHFTHGEASRAPMTIILGAIAVFIFWGRWKKAPILSRSV